jgi:hypothetical protein
VSLARPLASVAQARASSARRSAGLGDAGLASVRRSVLDWRVSRRTLAYVGIALALVAAGSMLATRTAPSRAPVPPTAAPPASASAPAPELPPLLQRPPQAVAEFGVLTDKTQAELAPALDRDALAGALKPAHCGDDAACEAVRATLRDEHATAIDVVDASVWDLAHADLDASARAFSGAERARIAKRARVVVVHVATPASQQALAMRTATAAAAAIAETAGGPVWDQLLNRIESARDFAKHAVTEPLAASAFRSDRIEFLYEPKEPGIVRVLTAGLSRWGAPDVEWQRVPAAASARVAAIVLAVARAIADGAQRGPLAIAPKDVAPDRVAGELDREAAENGGAGAAAEPVALDVVPSHPENGDPNDFMARVLPPGGEGAVATIELVERFFGPFVAAAPEPDAARAQAQAAQSWLSVALAKWSGARAHGSKLLVRLPFPIPGEAGVESMWIDVTGFDARTVTGTLVDEPLGATDFARGDTVTRPRADVERVELRANRDE